MSTTSKPILVGLLAAMTGLAGPAFSAPEAKEKKSVPETVSQKPKRIFLFSAKPTQEAWQFIKKNPGDRKAATEKAMKEIGCEMIGY